MNIRKIMPLFLIISLCVSSLTACSDNVNQSPKDKLESIATKSTEASTEEASTGSNTSTLVGYSDENALLLDYIRCLNGDVSLEEFSKAFSLDDLIIINLDNTTEVKSITEAYEILDALKAGTYDKDDETKEMYLEIMSLGETPEQITVNVWGNGKLNGWRERYAPFSETIDSELIHHAESELQQSTYQIVVGRDGDRSGPSTLVLTYIEKDGAYYWINMGEVW